MKEAGVSVVRLGHMAWSRIEADDNYYNLRWLNRVMDILFKHGIKVVLAIPTGSPPPWLVHKFPEILPVDAQGRRLQPGTYNHRCFLNKHYHDYARNFTMRLTKEIWGHRAILGWQIDGKIGAHRCYCETCQRAFLDWLKNRYKTVERLNAEWGTVAWGHEYTDFIQIPLPWQNTGAARDLRANHPSLILDFWRFSAHVVSEFVREQAVIVQRFTTRQFITLDCDEAWAGQNCFELAKSVDFVSCGTFVGPESLPFRHDVFFGIKQKDFWVMEHPIGAFGWNALGPSPRPGEARMRAWQAIGHGANTILFSPWRSSPSGTIQLAEGVLSHDGVPQRRYAEVKRMGEELNRINPSLESTQPRREVAILWDHEQQWALQIQPQTKGTGLDNEEIARWFHRALQRIGLNCELVGWKQDFTPFKLLLLPPQYMIDPERAEKLTQYVAAGGSAVVSTRSGIKNLRNVNYAEPAPATLRELLGIEVIDADVLGDDRSNLVRLTSGEEFAALRWCDVLALKGAEACGHYAQEFYKDSAALTVHAHGKGKAYYVATLMGSDFYRLFLTRLAEERGLRIYKDLPDDVDIVTRQKEGKELLFVTNQSGESHTVAIGRRGKNLLGGAAIESAVLLEPNGVAVVELIG